MREYRIDACHAIKNRSIDGSSFFGIYSSTLKFVEYAEKININSNSEFSERLSKFYDIFGTENLYSKTRYDKAILPIKSKYSSKFLNKIDELDMILRRLAFRAEIPGIEYHFVIKILDKNQRENFRVALKLIDKYMISLSEFVYKSAELNLLLGCVSSKYPGIKELKMNYEKMVLTDEVQGKKLFENNKSPFNLLTDTIIQDLELRLDGIFDLKQITRLYCYFGIRGLVKPKNKVLTEEFAKITDFHHSINGIIDSEELREDMEITKLKSLSKEVDEKKPELTIQNVHKLFESYIISNLNRMETLSMDLVKLVEGLF